MFKATRAFIKRHNCKPAIHTKEEVDPSVLDVYGRARPERAQGRAADSGD
jgi:hypothetical protein